MLQTNSTSRLGDSVDVDSDSPTSDKDYFVTKKGTKVVRYNMTDEQWAARIKQADEDGTIKEVGQKTAPSKTVGSSTGGKLKKDEAAGKERADAIRAKREKPQDPEKVRRAQAAGAVIQKYGQDYAAAPEDTRKQMLPPAEFAKTVMGNVEQGDSPAIGTGETAQEPAPVQPELAPPAQENPSWIGPKPAAGLDMPNTFGMSPEETRTEVAIRNPTYNMPGSLPQPPAYVAPGGPPVDPAQAAAAISSKSEASGALPAGSMSSSIRVKGVKPGGGGPPPLTAEQELMDAEIKAASKNTDDFLRKQAELRGKVKEEQLSVLEESARAAVKKKELLQRTRENSERYMNAYDSAMEEARQAASQGVDPDRFWASKGAGQKAAAVIAGALFGFTGQGMQWLQRLDNLVAQDIDAQKSDRESKVRGLQDYATSRLNLSERARQNGVDEAAQLDIDAAQRYEQLAFQIGQMADLTSDFNLQSNARNAVVALKERSLDRRMKVKEQADLQNFRYAQLQLERDKFEFEQKNGGRNGDKSAKAMSPTLQMRMAKTKDLYESLKEMRSLAASSGRLQRLRRAGAAATYSDEEKAKEDRYKELAMKGMLDTAQSSLQKPEQEYLTPIFGERSAWFDAVPAIDMRLKALEKRLAREAALFEAATKGDYDAAAELQTYSDFAGPQSGAAPSYAAGVEE